MTYPAGLEIGEPKMLEESRPVIRQRFLFIDVETTGIRADDRIVSLGFIGADPRDILSGTFDMRFGHFIFDPGKKSHPQAEAVHGYDDWTLRHQNRFDQFAPDLFDIFSDADMIVAHNAEFDTRFLFDAFGDCGRPLSGKSLFCTMLEYRDFYPSKSGLDFCLRRFGIKRRSKKHSALEDAWLCMAVWAALRGKALPPTPDALLSAPSNFLEPPPHPGVPLPRRKPTRRAGPVLLAP